MPTRIQTSSFSAVQKRRSDAGCSGVSVFSLTPERASAGSRSLEYEEPAVRASLQREVQIGARVGVEGLRFAVLEAHDDPAALRVVRHRNPKPPRVVGLGRFATNCDGCSGSGGASVGEATLPGSSLGRLSDHQCGQTRKERARMVAPSEIFAWSHLPLPTFIPPRRRGPVYPGSSAEGAYNQHKTPLRSTGATSRSRRLQQQL